jgi:hypothetical protein
LVGTVHHPSGQQVGLGGCGSTLKRLRCDGIVMRSQCAEPLLYTTSTKHAQHPEVP